MRTLLGFSILLFFVACRNRSVDLFNHQNLDGWYLDVPTKPNIKLRPAFVVRDGLLVSLGEPRGHLLTDSSYADYQLDVRYRFAGAPGNCGVLVHASEPRMLYKMFPRSIEVQLEHENAGDFWVIGEDIEVPDMENRRGPRAEWGNIEGKKRRILNLTDGTERPLGEWNELRIVCRGNTITVDVNGVRVNEGINCTVSSGRIALQAEGAEVEFSDVVLTPL